VGTVRWVPDHFNVVLACTLEEGTTVVGDVAVNSDKSTPATSFSVGVSFPILQPIDTDLAVDVAFLGISQSIRSVSAKDIGFLMTLTKHSRDYPVSSLLGKLRL
jgi:hypothetical protein